MMNSISTQLDAPEIQWNAPEIQEFQHIIPTAHTSNYVTGILLY